MIIVNLNTHSGYVEMMGVSMTAEEAENLANRLRWAAKALEMKVVIPATPEGEKDSE